MERGDWNIQISWLWYISGIFIFMRRAICHIKFLVYIKDIENFHHEMCLKFLRVSTRKVCMVQEGNRACIRSKCNTFSAY